MDLYGNCQDPVRCVESWTLFPNHTSGIVALQPLLSKPANPPGYRVGKDCNRSTSIVVYAGVHLDAPLSDPTDVREVEVLEIEE